MVDENLSNQGLTLRPWILMHIEKGDCGLCWENEEKTMFKIPWPKKTQADCERELKVCVEWAKHRNRYHNQPDYSDLKSTFRNVLYKSKYFHFMKKYSDTNKQCGNYRVYKILSTEEIEANRLKKKNKRSHPHSEEHPSQNNSIEASKLKTPNLNCNSCNLDKSNYERISAQKENFNSNQLILKASQVLIDRSQTVETNPSTFLPNSSLNHVNHETWQQLSENLVEYMASVGTLQQPNGRISSYHDIYQAPNANTSTIPLNVFDATLVETDDQLNLPSSCQQGQQDIPDLPDLGSDNLFLDNLSIARVETNGAQHGMKVGMGMEQFSLQQPAHDDCTIYRRTTASCNEMHGDDNAFEATDISFTYTSLETILKEFNISKRDLYTFKIAVHYKENKDFDHYEECCYDLSTGLRVLHKDGLNSDGNCCVLQIPDNYGKKPCLILQALQAFKKGIQLEVDENFVLFGTRFGGSKVFTFENNTVNSPSIEMKKKEKKELFSYANFINDLLMYRIKEGTPKPGCSVELVIGSRPKTSSSSALIRVTLTPLVGKKLQETFGKTDSLPELAISAPESTYEPTSKSLDELLEGISL